MWNNYNKHENANNIYEHIISLYHIQYLTRNVHMIGVLLCSFVM